MIGKFLKKVFGSRNSRIIKEYAVYIKAINDLEREAKSHEKIINEEFSLVKENKNNEVTSRSHG